jgi:hypothetical protein
MLRFYASPELKKKCRECCRVHLEEVVNDKTVGEICEDELGILVSSMRKVDINVIKGMRTIDK